jgi:hypothetical protein
MNGAQIIVSLIVTLAVGGAIGAGATYSATSRVEVTCPTPSQPPRDTSIFKPFQPTYNGKAW